MVTEADLQYLRNINTKPGADASKSIDPTKPGPDDGQCQSTPNEELRRQIMDSNVPKNEREWWAANEIERLERELKEAYSSAVDDEMGSNDEERQKLCARLRTEGTGTYQAADEIERLAARCNALERDLEWTRNRVENLQGARPRPLYTEDVTAWLTGKR